VGELLEWAVCGERDAVGEGEGADRARGFHEGGGRHRGADQVR
jgi:hypothetical protein